MRITILLYILGFVLFTNTLNAQNSTKIPHQYFEFKPHFGVPIIYSDSLSSTLNTPFYAIDFRWGVQTNGERSQDQFLNFPTYGLGMYHAFLSNPDTLGRPWAVYFFYSGPILRWNKFSINYEAALGVAWNFSKFDPVTNNKMDLIGSAVNAYFNGGINMKYQLSDRFDLGAAVDFTHFSNGAMNTPNKGMNLRGGNVFLRYYFIKGGNSEPYHRPEMVDKDLPKMKKYNVLSISTAIGGKATTARYGTGPIYFVSSTVIDYFRAYHYIGKYGAGLDLFYDNSISEDYRGQELSTPTSKYAFIGIHLSHELVISKLSVVTQAGSYLYKGTPAKGWFFFRLNLRYNFTKKFYAGIALKTANGFKADYIETGLGYNILW